MIEDLTFFVELPGRELLALLARPALLEALQRSGAALSLAMLDLSPERREAMRELAAHGIPLTAWLVVEEEHGYWLGPDNAARAVERYREVHGWLRAAGVRAEAVGLDLEPPLQDVRALLAEGRRALLALLRRRRSRHALEQARRLYGELVERVRADGHRVESYQFPIILDERRAGSSLLQRTLGLLDLPVDREVVMLYESLLPAPLGSLLVDSYGPDCQAIGVGVSGGGVPLAMEGERGAGVLEAMGGRRLQGGHLLEALRRARRYTPHLYVFSLEGCLETDSLSALLEAGLHPAPTVPRPAAGRALRAGLRLLLGAEHVVPGL